MMISRPRFLGFMVVLALTFTLVLTPGLIGAARAASEDVAMFYDDLSQYGEWADYDKYGPVWRPNKVPEDWRPYTDGRWVPTDNGYVFESQEPWSWATYHYGNWMPTEGNGWVWVPGRTWYPSTVEWRTTPETAPVDASYVGWAPIPPPDYAPPQGYAPPSYYQGSPLPDSLSSPLWIFARVAEFLLGLGQPYTPAYSYMTTGILVPPMYVPVFYPQTVIVGNYVTPAYYPPGFMGARRFGFAAYNWGPPMGYVTRFGRVNPTVFNQAINYNSVNITRIHNVVAPAAVLNRHGYVRQIIPPALAQGRRLPPPQAVQNIRMAQANLNKPNILPPLKNVPRLSAQIPRFQPAALAPGRGLPGTALPARATMPLTPQMTQQIQQLPPQQRFVPAAGRSFAPAAATQTGPGPGQPAQTQRGGPPAGGARPGEFHPGTTRPGVAPAAPTNAGVARPGGAPLPPGYQGMTPEQRRQQELEHQRLQRGGAASQQGQQRPAPNDAERLRQQQLPRDQQQRQLQQQRQREQQVRPQQERQPQVQQRQQQQRQEQERLRRQQQQQGQQQRQREQQVRQQQQRQQQEGQRQPQVQPQRPQPQARPQVRQEQQHQEQKKKPEPQ